MTCWYVCSFDTKFSDGNDPPSSDIVVKKSQNSRSVSDEGSDPVSCAAATLLESANAATSAARPSERASSRGRRCAGEIGENSITAPKKRIEADRENTDLC